MSIYRLCCDDLEKAARNREMVTNREKVEAYILAENLIERIPAHCPLPTWLQSSIPTIPNTGFTFPKDYEKE